MSAIRHGLYILLVLLNHGDSMNISKLFDEWQVTPLVEDIKKSGFTFPVKDKLCSLLLNGMPTTELPMDDLLDETEEQTNCNTIEYEVMSVLRILRSDRFLKNPLSKLVKLIDKDLSVMCSQFIIPPSELTTLFLQHHGVIYLSETLDTNKMNSFTECGLL